MLPSRLPVLKLDKMTYSLPFFPASKPKKLQGPTSTPHTLPPAGSGSGWWWWCRCGCTPVPPVRVPPGTSVGAPPGAAVPPRPPRWRRVNLGDGVNLTGGCNHRKYHSSAAPVKVMETAFPPPGKAALCSAPAAPARGWDLTDPPVFLVKVEAGEPGPGGSSQLAARGHSLGCQKKHRLRSWVRGGPRGCSGKPCSSVLLVCPGRHASEY